MKAAVRRVKRIVLYYRNIRPLLRAASLLLQDLARGPKGKLIKISPSSGASDSLLRDGPSPIRLYMDVALQQAINRHCPVTGAFVLDIGCGRGGYSKEFTNKGVAGEYFGLDLTASPEWQALQGDLSGLRVSFLAMPVQEIDYVHRQFNFSFSLSTLHYIDNDTDALEKVYEHTVPGSYSVHCVPSLWSYLQFINQGVRRYSAQGLRDATTNAGFEVLEIRKLGGAFSFLLHWLWITNLETGLMLPAMRKQSTMLKFYTRLLRTCVALDRFAPFMEAGYYVLARKPVGTTRA